MKLNNEQKKALYEEGYKFCFDVVKLILGGVIFAGIMQDNIDRLGCMLGAFSLWS